MKYLEGRWPHNLSDFEYFLTFLWIENLKEEQKNFTDEQICNIKSQCADEIEILLPRNIQIQIDSISEAICKRTAGKLPNFNFYIIEATILNT